MLHDIIYRGYRIKWRRAAQLWAVIWPPDSELALAKIPRATTAEGQDVLERRSYALIDAEIAKNSPG
jgi:hypothetical protein